MFKVIAYYADGHRIEHFDDWNDAATWLDFEVEWIRATGGDIYSFVLGIGWVLCNEEINETA